MMQIIEMTNTEKVKMYKKLSKGELIAMLMENQRLVEILSLKQPIQYIPHVEPYITPWPTTPFSPYCQPYTTSTGTITTTATTSNNLN